MSTNRAARDGIIRHAPVSAFLQDQLVCFKAENSARAKKQTHLPALPLRSRIRICDALACERSYEQIHTALARRGDDVQLVARHARLAGRTPVD